jgi:hypothetical protein
MTLQEVMVRREALFLRIAAQRQDVALQAEPLRPMAGFFDRGYAIAQTFRRAHPALLIGAGVLAFALVSKRLPIVRMTSAALTAVRWWIAIKSRSQPF